MSKSRIIDILVNTEQAVNLIFGLLDVFDELDKAQQDDVITAVSKDIQRYEEKGTFKDAVDMVIDEGIADEEILKDIKELADQAKSLLVKTPQGMRTVWDYLNRIVVNFRYCRKYVSALKTDKPTEDKTLELPNELNTEEAERPQILRYNLNREKVAGLFKALQDAVFLGKDTSRNDWHYICGVEDVTKAASNPIDWRGTQAELAYLIQEVFKDSPKPWKICASAFTVKGKRIEAWNLKSSASRVKSGERDVSKALAKVVRGCKS